MNWLQSILSRFRPSRQSGQPSGAASASLDRLEKRLGYRFERRELLEQALTHRSYLHDAAKNRDGLQIEDYESLEFFGDAVLGLVISEALFRSCPHLHEGDLSKLKAHLVSTRQLCRLSCEMEVGPFLRLSFGEEKTGGRNKRAILADVFESLTAAIYLDGGLQAAQTFVISRFRPLLDKIAERELELHDYKSALQEELHSAGLTEPSYRVVAESGPDHRKRFVVEVMSLGKPLAKGEGLSKKEAEQQAAEAALKLRKGSQILQGSS